MKSILKMFFATVLLLATASTANAGGYGYGGPQGYGMPSSSAPTCVEYARNRNGWIVGCRRYVQQRPPQMAYYGERRYHRPPPPAQYRQRRAEPCWECAAGAILGLGLGYEIHRNRR